MIDQNTITQWLSQYKTMRQRIKTIENITSVSESFSRNFGYDMPDTTSELDNLKSLIAMLDKMIYSLSQPEREIMTSLYIDGLTYDKASEVRDVSRSTVCARRKSAIKKMAKMI